MAIDPSMFAEDFLVALDDLSTIAYFSNFTVEIIFQKVNQQETPMMEGVEDNTSATMFVSLDELGSDDINIGDKCTIDSNNYRVKSILPYPHGQFFEMELTDYNS